MLNALTRSANPRITVFADAQCAHESFATQHHLIEGLGERYRVVPVAMSAHFRFHPKAVLLAGEDRATLFVGSGNLTFGGWRDNLEVWTRLDTATDSSTPFLQFRKYLDEFVPHIPLGGGVIADIEDAFDHPWAAVSSVDMASSATLIGRGGSGTSLLQRMLAHVGEGPVNAMYVCCPYFDEQGTGLRELIRALTPTQATVLYQPRGSTLTAGAHAANSGVALRHVTFERPGLDGAVREAFIHAKFYCIVRGAMAWVLAGSANCSIAALTLDGPAGNAELMVAMQMPTEDFHTQWLGDLPEVAEAATPPEALPTEEGQHGVPVLRVLAARLVEGNTLQVAFWPQDAAVIRVRLDDGNSSESFAYAGRGEVTVVVQDDSVRLVALGAEIDGVVIESAVIWIDHEVKLRAVPAHHAAMDALRERTGPGRRWNANAWAHVMSVFCKHLSSTSASVASRRLAAARGPSGAGAGNYSFADVFSPGYELPRLDTVGLEAAAAITTTTDALQSWLLHWFAPPPTTPPADPDDGTGAGTLRLRPRPKPQDMPPDKREPMTDPKRIAKLLNSACALLTSSDKCSVRAATDLRLDLGLAAVLLGTALREQWIGQQTYFDTTQKIWGALFLYGGPDAPRGWVNKRAEDPESGAAFREEMRHPMLSASLIAWALTMPQVMSTPQAARFHFTVALAVARNEWLWWGGDPLEVAAGLQTFMRGAGPVDVSSEDVEAAWLAILQRGKAFAELEQAMTLATPSTMRETLKCQELEVGDLLWQGRSGYCMALRAAKRRDGFPVSVHWIQDPTSKTELTPESTLPVHAVLTEDRLDGKIVLGAAQTTIVQRFVSQLRQAHKPAKTLNI